MSSRSGGIPLVQGEILVEPGQYFAYVFSIPGWKTSCRNFSLYMLIKRGLISLTLKRFDSIWPPYRFSKNVCSREIVKPWVFVAINIILSYLFSEDFIEIHQIV